MPQIWTLFLLMSFLLVNLVNATEQTPPKAASIAKEKAEMLEKKVSDNDSETPPKPAETITKHQARAVDPSGEEPLEDVITCLARSIYWEANRTNDAEMEAIASVVMNRLGHEGFPSTICEIVKQGQEQGSCQFSWWCDGRLDDAQEEESYSRAKEIARIALNQQLQDPTDGAMYFHNRKVTPDWSSEYIRTAKIGEHIFYKPADGKAK